MKKLLVLLLSLFLIQTVSALSSTLKNSYESRETIIGKFSDNIIGIEQENANVLKDGHVEVGFNGEIKKLGAEYYIWFPAPQNPGNYTLLIEEVIANIGGYPDVLDFAHSFNVNQSVSDYSIIPGFVLSSDDFDIGIALHEEFSKEIEVSYPFSRSVIINPGNNVIDFELEEFVGNKLVLIDVGKYVVPAFLIGQEYVCGDGEIDGQEACDGFNLNGRSCATFGFEQGELFCANNCLSFDESNCTFTEQECNERHLELCLNENNCTSAMGFWYNNTCNKYEQGALCDKEHLGLCQTEEECSNARGFWYNQKCNEEEQKICELDNLELCNSFLKCRNAGGYWYDKRCNKERELFLKFDITPRIIRSIIHIEESPGAYPFRLDNLGGRIENFTLEYDERKFIIQPSNLLAIEENESVYFNLSLKEFNREPIRSAIVAYAGDHEEYLLFDLKLTSNRSEIITSFSKNTTQKGYYCSELGGKGCGQNDICVGNLVSSLDKQSCCLGQCETQKSSTKAWIGYLIAGIIILILLIIYVKYKKAGRTENSVQKRFADAERKLP